MTSKSAIYVLTALLALGAAVWYWQWINDVPAQATSALANKASAGDSSTSNALAQTINECDLITEKSAAHLTAVVEFQKLEIIGRKAAVFKHCMLDRAYRENPAWTQFFQPLIATKAQHENTSLDEALENLRREKMKLLKPAVGEPSYWVTP